MPIKFGTDGVRGAFSAERNLGEGLVSPEVGFRVGAAAVETLGIERFVMVKDTRPFNDELAAAIKDGVASRGGMVVDAGVLPTPATAFLAGKLSESDYGDKQYAAISVSASHNPVTDAGIKVFGAKGHKLNTEETSSLQATANKLTIRRNTLDLRLLDPSKQVAVEWLREAYIEMLLGTVSRELSLSFLSGQDIVVDTANGAAHWSAPEVLSRLGANVIAINSDPEAEINKNCGATHIEPMIAAVRESNASYGMALDGDADRLISFARSRYGERVLDGDDAVALLVEEMHSRGQFGPSPRVVVTDYSSVGFKRQMDKHGVGTTFVENGDRYVLEELAKGGGLAGGEKAGHVLLPTITNANHLVLTGDGTLTALQQLQTAALHGASLDQIINYPELGYARADVPVPKGVDTARLVSSVGVRQEILLGDLFVGEDGKVLVRGSGTEPVVRVLAKTAHGQDLADNIVSDIESAIREAA